MRLRTGTILSTGAVVIASLLAVAPAEAATPKRQQITGHVTGLGASLASNVRVELVKGLRGGNTKIVKGQDVRANGGAFALTVNLGAKGAPSEPYRLRIRGTDHNGVTRTWYWRGTSGKPSGGGAYLRDGSVIRATRSGPFRAEVTYGSISGTTAPGAEVTVASPPPTYSGGRDVLRELDIPSCANYFGVTRADAGGAYSVGFLPVTGSANTRYLVGVRHGSTQAWYGRTDQRFGSCYDATSYQRSRRHLIALTGPVTGKALSTAASGNTLKITARYASSYKPTAQGDRWIRLREKVPGVKILDAPVVAEGAANSAGVRSFSNLRPGRYWVEVGRRTGCADWYPSKYSNNNQYFKGMDRASERWKSFRRLRDLPGNAQRGFEHVARTADPNPARGDKHNKIPRGYKGWTYRGYCKALGAGTISTVTVSGTGRTVGKTMARTKRGAVVKGRVTRTGGRTNKEMMVRLSSSAGTRVIRTDLTDGSGTFYVAGLPSGRWTISVNSDSWRGIGRDFSGRHSITVKAGKRYNVGTLRFER